MFMGQQFYF